MSQTVHVAHGLEARHEFIGQRQLYKVRVYLGAGHEGHIVGQIKPTGHREGTDLDTVTRWYAFHYDTSSDEEVRSVEEGLEFLDRIMDGVYRSYASDHGLVVTRGDPRQPDHLYIKRYEGDRAAGVVGETVGQLLAAPDGFHVIYHDENNWGPIGAARSVHAALNAVARLSSRGDAE